MAVPDAPGRDLGGGRALSALRVVGELAPPHGYCFEDVLANPVAERECLLDFHSRAAQLLGVSAARIHLQKKPGATDVEKAKRRPGHWHRDSFLGPGPLVCLIGDSPTEFLLGEYDQRDLDARDRHGVLENSMQLWRPNPCELVLIDRLTVHRRPRLVTGVRLYLLASVDSSVFTAMRAKDQHEPD